MAFPKPVPRVKTNIDLAPAMHAKLVNLAEQRGVPLVHVIRQALAEYLARNTAAAPPVIHPK